MTGSRRGARSTNPTLVAVIALCACGFLTQFACAGATGNEGAAQPNTVTVTWGDRSFPGPYAERPYPAQEVFFGKEKANVPLPPVFATSNGGDAVSLGWPRADLSFDDTPLGKGKQIISCGVAVEQVTRVTGTSPFSVEREFTWSGTRTEPCIGSTPLPSGCHVVQQIRYPVAFPGDAEL